MGEALASVRTIAAMDADFARDHQAELYELVQLIPEVHYEASDLLATAKPDGRVMHAKWRHCYTAFADTKLAGLVMGYERVAEAGTNYTESSLYISELAVACEYQGQGYAQALLSRFLGDALLHGFAELAGSLRFSVQTNGAEWNRPVRRLYETFGFQVVGSRTYRNRVDAVLQASRDDVAAALEARS